MLVCLRGSEFTYLPTYPPDRRVGVHDGFSFFSFSGMCGLAFGVGNRSCMAVMRVSLGSEQNRIRNKLVTAVLACVSGVISD